MSDEKEQGINWPHVEPLSMPTTGVWAQKRRLAAAMRTVIDRLVITNAPEDKIREAADALEYFAGTLGGYPTRSKLWGYAESSTAGNVAAFFDLSPMIGLANPLAPPITMHPKNDRVYGEVVFGSAYEGPPGSVHGGYVAAAFDEVLGFAQSLTGSPGMTGTLTVRYRRPTPLHTELRFEGWVDRVEGRKIFTRAELRAAGELTAEAEGLFISIDQDRFAELLEKQAEQERRRRSAEED
ncbi:MAG: PaaI family thioesterase [Candidatus Dadabacteria bacterium]|nr:MAG: PaaI family thioesterase [Candidatus Dadabacteria bacterium]